MQLSSFCLSIIPTQMHLGITSRTMPGISLARLRALDQVVEINAADLRFTDAEIRAFLEQMGASLTPDQIHAPEPIHGRLGSGTCNSRVLPSRASLLIGIFPPDRHIFSIILPKKSCAAKRPKCRSFSKSPRLFDRFCAPLCEHLIDTSASCELMKLAESSSGAGQTSRLPRTRQSIPCPARLLGNLVSLPCPVYRIPASPTSA